MATPNMYNCGENIMNIHDRRFYRERNVKNYYLQPSVKGKILTSNKLAEDTIKINIIDNSYAICQKYSISSHVSLHSLYIFY